MVNAGYTYPQDSLGPYRLLGELGRGAMARVWRAFDSNLEREVAIKEPLFDPSLSDQVREELNRRFIREGRAAAMLTHPNIVTIYAADIYNGRPAIVMELIEGATLREILQGGPLTPAQALSVLDQLLDAIGYAHQRGIVHRDIKPDNIFIRPDGVVKLTDFGIARVDDAIATHSTHVGAILGTPGYMSPEQATGNPVDARSDLFSVGTVAYELLMGYNPFGAGSGINSSSVMYRIVHEPVSPLPPSAYEGLPVDIRPAIMAALAKNPENRPQTASAFKAMLHGSMAVPVQQAPETISTSYGSVGGTEEEGNNSGLLPFVIFAAIALVFFLFIFMSAGGGAGGGPSSETPSSEASNSVQPSTQEVPAEASKQTYLGSWTIESSTATDDNGNELTAENIAKLGYVCTFVVNEDGSWTLNDNGTSISGTWTSTGDSSIAIKVDDSTEGTGTYSNGKLTLDINGGHITFVPAST